MRLDGLSALLSPRWLMSLRSDSPIWVAARSERTNKGEMGHAGILPEVEPSVDAGRGCLPGFSWQGRHISTASIRTRRGRVRAHTKATSGVGATSIHLAPAGRPRIDGRSTDPKPGAWFAADGDEQTGEIASNQPRDSCGPTGRSTGRSVAPRGRRSGRRSHSGDRAGARGNGSGSAPEEPKPGVARAATKSHFHREKQC